MNGIESGQRSVGRRRWRRRMRAAAGFSAIAVAAVLLAITAASAHGPDELPHPPTQDETDMSIFDGMPHPENVLRVVQGCMGPSGMGQDGVYCADGQALDGAVGFALENDYDGILLVGPRWTTQRVSLHSLIHIRAESDGTLLTRSSTPMAPLAFAPGAANESSLAGLEIEMPVAVTDGKLWVASSSFRAGLVVAAPLRPPWSVTPY